MNRTIQTNTQNFNGPESSNTTTIRRTLVEHGVRPVNDDTQTQNGPSTNLSAITALAKQHQDEQRELQQLNAKLSSYLGHVHDLETFNGQLLAELDDLKQKWGYDTDKLHATYDSQLKTLRDGINNSLRDQILPELQLKQYEYDIWQTQQRINALGGDPRYRFNELEQELNNGIKDLERLKNQFDRRSTEIVQQRTNLENLGNEFDGLQNELLNQRLERLMLQNELQTLREDLAFQDAIYQAQRQEILSLSVPSIDSSKFYRNELVYAISDIQQDFEILSQAQFKELEEYYRIKTEEIKEIAKENERKRLLTSEHEIDDITLDSSSFAKLKEEYEQLKLENSQLQTDLNGTEDDLERILGEHMRENEKYNLELNQLQQELDNKQAIINGILENNISLRFELSTYRNLLNLEEKRLNRVEQNQQIQTSSLSSNQNQNNPNQRATDVLVQTSPSSNQNQNNLNEKVNDYAVQTSSPSSNQIQKNSNGKVNDYEIQTSSPSSNQIQKNPNEKVNDFKVQKLDVQKTARGPIIFDSIDFANDCVIIIYDTSTGDRQSLANWTLHHQNDQQPEIVYQFPSSSILRPRQKIRILTKRSPQSARLGFDVLIADQIDTWGSGQGMITRLIDNNNEEIASIKQTRVPA